MNVLLLTDEADFESALPTLRSFAQTVRQKSLDERLDGGHGSADVAIIDARIDLMAGRRVCRCLTANAPGLAVVAVITPRDFVEVDVDWHFDDVLLAPACGAELQARLRLALTRRRSALEGSLQFGEFVLHPGSYTASRGSKDLGLTLTEFKLLNFLVQHAGRAFTRTRLMHEVRGYDCNGRIRTVDVHVRRLRAKLRTDRRSMIDTVRGIGYMAVTPPQPRWIVGEPIPSPIRPTTAESTKDSVTQ